MFWPVSAFHSNESLEPLQDSKKSFCHFCVRLKKQFKPINIVMDKYVVKSCVLKLCL